MKQVTYRVKPVTRWVLSRSYYEQSEDGGACAGGGDLAVEFDRAEQAVQVARVLLNAQKAEEPDSMITFVWDQEQRACGGTVDAPGLEPGP